MGSSQKLLKFSKSLGSHVIVGINDDESVKRLKGSNRPINSCDVRVAQLKALPWVSEVVVFSEDTPLESIKVHKPDIIVKGADYNEKDVVGRELAKVVLFPILKGLSTSSTLKKAMDKET